MMLWQNSSDQLQPIGKTRTIGWRKQSGGMGGPSICLTLSKRLEIMGNVNSSSMPFGTSMW
eukprot:905362-Pyramimonas_sp.AAC.1